MSNSNTSTSKKPWTTRPTRIGALDFPTGLWRIDWFGDVSFPDLGERYTEPSVCVALSDVSAPLLARPQTQQQVWLPVGFLPRLRIGDLWQHGYLEEEASAHRETFVDVDITPDTTKLIRAGVSEDGHFFLPLGEHAQHRGHTQSYCVIVTLPDRRRLVVPCWELISFYFGTSSKLISLLFKPDLQKNMLFEHTGYHQETGRLFIDLAEGVSGYAAADVGRIAMSNVAWHAAQQVGRSCVTAKASGGKIYPRSGFPFRGLTTLSASGVWVSHAGEADATFVVHQLHSCSHPFAFKSLRFSTHKQRQSEQQSTGDKTRFVPQETFDESSLVNQDPGRNKAKRERAAQDNVRFPDLVGKPVWKRSSPIVPGGDGTTPLPQRRHVQEAVESTGDPVSNSDARAVDLVIDVLGLTNRRDIALPEWAYEAWQRLKSQVDGEVLPIVLPDSPNGVFTLPALVDAAGSVQSIGRLPWSENEVVAFRHTQSRSTWAALDGCELVFELEIPAYMEALDADHQAHALAACTLAAVLNDRPWAPADSGTAD